MGRSTTDLDAVVADGGNTADGFFKGVGRNPAREAGMNPSVKSVLNGINGSQWSFVSGSRQSLAFPKTFRSTDRKFHCFGFVRIGLR
jgi:hypothetical protein